MSEEINCFKIHRIVEYIRNNSEGIIFDTADLLDEEIGVIGVLKMYNLYYQISKPEEDIILNDLFDLALRVEIAEITRSMHPDEYLAMHGTASPAIICPETDAFPVEEGPILA